MANGSVKLPAVADVAAQQAAGVMHGSVPFAALLAWVKSVFSTHGGHA